MRTILDFFPESLTSALGFTLLHSLWQGALVLLVLWVLLLGVKKASSKYWLASIAQCVILFGAIVTFCYLYYPKNQSLSAVENGVYRQIEVASNVMLSELTQEENFHVTSPSLLAFFWLLGVCFFAIRIAFSLFFVRQLKGSYDVISDSGLLKLLQTTKEKLGVFQMVTVGESSRISGPVVVGWLKPVILFPVGMINGLSYQHVEAILAHELAHIKRNDYLINILQSFVEVIFFFNPFVWVLSAIIRKERENACDDLAVQVSGSPMVVSKALLAVADYTLQPKLAVAFGGKKTGLTTRIKRMIGVVPQYKEVNFLGLFLVVSLITGGIVYAQESRIKSNRKVNLSGIVMDTETMKPLTNVQFFDKEKQLLGTSNTQGYFTVVVPVNDEGEIVYTLNAEKDGYKLFKQNERWGDLGDDLYAGYYLGMSRSDSNTDTFSSLMMGNKVESFEKLNKGLPEYLNKVSLTRGVYALREGNEKVFFAHEGKYYIVNNFGYCEIKSGNDKILVDGKTCLAKDVNEALKRSQIKGMTSHNRGEVAVEMKTK